jgi:hypothetical protein
VAAGDPELTTGWAWIGAAIYEAVDAGSAYVAPRRIREIAARWRREGRPGAVPPSLPPPDGDAGATDIPPPVLSMMTGGRADDREGHRQTRVPPHAAAPATEPRAGDQPWEGDALWDAVTRELARDLEPVRLAELARLVVARVTPDEVELVAPPPIAAALAGEDRPHLTRALSVVLRRTVRLTIRPTATEPVSPPSISTGDGSSPSLVDGPAALTTAAPPAGRLADTEDGPAARRRREGQPRRARRTDAGQGEAAQPTSEQVGEPTAVATSTGRDDGIGLSDAHLWAAVVDEVVRGGDVSPADVTAWLKPARIAGRTAAGYAVVAPSAIARRRLDGPLRPALETALARVIGPGATFEVATAPTHWATLG